MSDVGSLTANSGKLSAVKVVAKNGEGELWEEFGAVRLKSDKGVLETAIINLTAPKSRSPHEFGTLSLVEKNIPILKAVCFKISRVEVHGQDVG